MQTPPSHGRLTALSSLLCIGRNVSISGRNLHLYNTADSCLTVLTLHLFNCGVHSMFRDGRYTAEISKFITTSYWPKTGQQKSGDQYPLRLAIDLLIIANNLYELLSIYGIKRGDLLQINKNLHHWSDKCSSSNTFTVTSCIYLTISQEKYRRATKMHNSSKKISNEKNQTVCIVENN